MSNLYFIVCVRNEVLLQTHKINKINAINILTKMAKNIMFHVVFKKLRNHSPQIYSMRLQFVSHTYMRLSGCYIWDVNVIQI